MTLFKKKEPREPKKRRLQIHEATHENDIRYRGPLSFQHFQILGWLCIVLSQVVILMKLGGRIDAQFATDTAGTMQLLSNLAEFSLPFLLIANFAQIIDDSNGYRKLLIRNIAAAAAICGVFYLFFYRYFIGGIQALIDDPTQAMPLGMTVVREVAAYGFYDFNIFIDLLLCTLVMLFLNYRPKRVFTGRWVHVFRAFALLPIAYEVGSMALKIRAAMGQIDVPVWVYPLLTVKPPMTFVLFIVLALFVKTRELRFRRHGKTHEEYTAFLRTRRNAWHFSIFLAIMMVVVSVVDFGVVLGFSVGEGVSSLVTRMEDLEGAETEVDAAPTDGAPTDAGATDAAPEAQKISVEDIIALLETEVLPSPTPSAEPQTRPLTEEEREAALQEYIESEEMMSAVEKGALIATAVGFGGSINLIILAPFVLLFFYTRKPKFPWISLLIPLAGIILILFVYFEGVHQLLLNLPMKKVSVQELLEYQQLLSAMLM